ncbi:hypothetical protein H4R19_003297 [Coemansia spiralis]|nr:hypothetical protein H4R19_003297 [Coemansia spiralis]
MRKSTSLKLGLNVRKPALGAAGAQARERADGSGRQLVHSVFRGSPADDPDEAPAAQPVFSGGSQAREAEKLASEIATSDPSVYAYDEVYDDLDQARNRAKKAQRADDYKPRYMDKLIETAKQRKVQSDVVRERLLAKERAREGDMYADKEVIVTAGYKDIKEQREKLVAEDEAREASAQAASGRGQHFGTATAGLYKEFLDRVDREDAAIAAAAAATSRSLDGPAPEPADRPEALGSGLNVMAASAQQRPAAAPQHPSDVADGVLQGRAAGQRGRHWPQPSSMDLAAEADRRDDERVAEQDRQHQELVQKYARRNDAAAVEAARQRYLERRQQQAC